MDIDKVLETRRSIREYSDKKIPWKLLSEVLNAATHSPSSGNLQNFKMVIVTKEDKKKEIATACLKQSWMEDAPTIIAICADYSKIKKFYEETYEELSLQNCTIAAYSIMLKATSLGLGTCYVSIFDSAAISRVLKLDDNIKPIIMLTIGYPNEKPEKIRRLPLSSLMNYEEYGNKKR